MSGRQDRTRAVADMIERLGRPYEVRNADDSGADRTVETYQQTGTLTAVLETVSGTQVIDSSGTEVEANSQLRAVPDGQTLREAGADAGSATRLVHPDGRAFEIVNEHVDDSGVTVLTVVLA